MGKNIFLLLMTVMIFPVALMAQNKPVLTPNFSQINPVQPPQTFVAITQALKKPQLIRANFKQAKYLKVLKRPFISSGKLIFSRDKGVYWEITHPLNNAYVINEEGIKLISNPADNVLPSASPISESISRTFSSIIGGDIEVLGDTFDISYLGDLQKWTIKLQPKDKLIAKVLASILLSGSDAINEIIISENSGDHTEITFSQMSRDQGELSSIESDYFGG